MAKNIRLLVALVSLVVVCVIVGAAVVWVKAEAVPPSRTHFPLANGSQQALLACSAGYALMKLSESPLSVVQAEAEQAAGVSAEFQPLVLYAAQGLESKASQRGFTSFCVGHQMWP